MIGRYQPLPGGEIPREIEVEAVSRCPDRAFAGNQSREDSKAEGAERNP